MESGVSYRPCVGRAPTPTDGAPTQLRIASFIRVLSWMAELHICPRLGRKALKHRADEGRNPKLSLQPQLSSLTNFQMTDRCEYLQLQFDQVKTRLEVNSLDWSQHLIDDIARLALCTVAVAIRVGKKKESYPVRVKGCLKYLRTSSRPSSPPQAHHFNRTSSS